MSKRTSDDDLYAHSSQFLLWSFTEDQLRDKRQETNERSWESTQKLLSSLKEEVGDAQYTTITEKVARVQVEDELKLIAFFLTKVAAIGKALELPSEVKATAISFLKKFYLVHTPVDMYPKDVIFSCVFLACKSENYFISLNTFCKKLKLKQEDVVTNEFKLLESLKFSLLTHHPFRPLHGLYLDIQNTMAGKISSQQLGKVYDGAKKLLNDSLLSDAAFLFTPPQIALAALLDQDEELTLQYLNTKFAGVVMPSEPVPQAEEQTPPAGSQQEGEPEVKKEAEETPEPGLFLDTLLPTLRRCQVIMKERYIPDKEEAKRADAKVHFSRNPKLALKRKAEEAPADDPKKQKV